MKTTLNITFDTALMATIAATLKNSEMGRLMRALTARMCGEDAEQYLNNSALRLAFALLSPAIDESLERRATDRANGSRGGRPRKQPAQPVESLPEKRGFESVSAKKSKKEDLPPTPPIEEKNKKNIPVVDVADARTREEFEQEIFDNDLKIEQACMSLDISPQQYRQMARAVLNEWDFTEEDDRSYKHFMNTLRIKAREQKRSKTQYHGQHKTRHDITDTTAVSAKDYEGPF